MLPSGRSRSSAGNSSNTMNTTGGRRSAERAGSSSPGRLQPVSSSPTASSAASQDRHLAIGLHLEDLDPVAPVAQGFLGDHDGIALHLFATQVEASPNSLDPAIHRNGDVALAA